MTWFERLRAWWHRDVGIVRHRKNVTEINVSGDGADARQILLVSRWELFDLAAAIEKTIRYEREVLGHRLHDVTLELDPEEVDPIRHGYIRLQVPDWARRRLYRAILREARHQGWDGKPPQRNRQVGAYR